jgi:uncharacterized membrane protein YeaQ/YmgE (transglycosylase-associated protein family)
MKTIEQLSYTDIVLIIAGVLMGTIARIITLQVDNRQNPSFPGGVFNNLVTGFIASILGAVAIPALIAKDFTAVTFLALAIQHFREVRKIEGESLSRVEYAEYTKRGEAYIDGIAKTYESRNYISLLTALFTVLVMRIFYTDILYVDGAIGFVTGICFVFVVKFFTKGKTIGDICTITTGKITIENSDLSIDGMFVSNLLGSDVSRDMFLNEGVGLVVTPKKSIYRVTIDNYGQRQAILYEAIRSVGVKRYKFMRKSFDTGKLLIAFVPIINDVNSLISSAKKTPVLENSRKNNSIMSGKDGGVENG